MTTITAIGPLVVVKDVSADPDHQVLAGGASYGLWVDGPPHPYKDAAGNIYVHAPCSENYRFNVGTGGSWANGAAWVKQGPVMTSNRATGEQKYANRHWLYGFYAIGNTVYSLAHHEWYQTMTADSGIWGFNGYSLPFRRWVNATGWAKSTNGGATFAIKPAGVDPQRQRNVLTPELWAVQSRDTMYGFFHPSNIVKEGSYYYAFVEYRGLEGGTNLLKQGFCMVRTNNLDNATGWQYWNGTGWTTVSSTLYQGNTQAQKPYVFFAQTGWDPYAVAPTTSRMAQSIRWYPPGSKWLVFGHTRVGASAVSFLESVTLANPQFETNGIKTVNLAGQALASDYGGAHYFSVFSTGAADQNFQDLNTPTIHAMSIDALSKYRLQAFSIAP